MGTSAMIADDLRSRIISHPDVILEDLDLMRALVAANEDSLGGNVVDLRGIAMQRLESRLDRLENTHRTVIAAAYDNLAGTNQIHRAVTRLLDSPDFEGFLHDLGTDVAAILRVDALRLVLETEECGDAADLSRLSDVLTVVSRGTVADYLSRGHQTPTRRVVLRRCPEDAALIFGPEADGLGSEACLALDFGPDRLPGMLALGAHDANLFDASHGTDLLGFFAGVFERSMRRWLT